MAKKVNPTKDGCHGTTKTGAPCKRNAQAGTDTCAQHSDTSNTVKAWIEPFFEMFSEFGMVAMACRNAKVSRSTVYLERKENPAFSERWDEIESETTDEMERAAYERAVDGVVKPTAFGNVKVYSDTLLIFMLKARKPDVYRERVDIKHEGTIKNEIGVAVPEGASSEDLHVVADELAARRARRAA